MAPGKLQGCKRGVFGLMSWEPINKNGSGSGDAAMANGLQAQPKSAPPAPPKKSTKQRIVAKYNYKANSNSPLGHELDVVQGQKLFYIETHQDNEHWWLAQNDNGDMGYVPADYMMVLKDNGGQLPWLENQSPSVSSSGGSAFGVPSKAPFKPYKSSYEHEGIKSVSKTADYYCDVCDKQLNGPQPYKAHMASKAHHEALEEQGMA